MTTEQNTQRVSEIIERVSNHVSLERKANIPRQCRSIGGYSFKKMRVWVVNENTSSFHGSFDESGYVYRDDSSYGGPLVIMGETVISKNIALGYVWSNLVNDPTGLYVLSQFSNYEKKYPAIHELMDAVRDSIAELYRYRQISLDCVSDLRIGFANDPFIVYLPSINKKNLRELIDKKGEEKFDLRNFIHNQTSLRLNPNLDNTQLKIKFSNLYDGNAIIIEGCPGSGKTTTMIQRLKLLIEENALLDQKNLGNLSLTEEDIKLVCNNDRWVFFSPSAGLCDYLETNMSSECLPNPKSHSRVLSDYFNKIIRDSYRFDKSFKLRRDKGFFSFKSLSVVDAFSRQFERYVKKSLKTAILKYNSWSTLGKLVTSIIANAYSSENNTLRVVMSNVKNSFLGRPYSCNVAAYREILHKTPKSDYTDEQKEFITLYDKYAKYSSFILDKIIDAYKSFRKELLVNELLRQKLGVDKEILREAITENLLYSCEQSLLMGFINNYIKLIPISERPNHKYVKSFESECKTLIGIDEATDFNLYEYYALRSFAHERVCSFLLSGDIMQGMNRYGIANWGVLGDKNIFGNKMIVYTLEKSYRQSPALLKLSQYLYQSSTGGELRVVSAMTPLEHIPSPLWHKDDSHEDNLHWIAERIVDVKNIYENLPSIAIFAKNKIECAIMIDELNSIDILQDEGIFVTDGTMVGNNSGNVRVYPINLIKGMEFDVVFFNNIQSIVDSEVNSINSNDSLDIIQKYIYVGLSRAAFYLGVTSSESGLSEDLQKLSEQFDCKDNWAIKE